MSAGKSEAASLRPASVQPEYDVLVVGAGLCGLIAASVVAGQGLRVAVIDKGRSVGGRLATRRLGEGRADHGAQFFTVRDPRFGERVAAWEREGLVYVWSHGWSSGSLDAAGGDSHPRYAVRGGMNALAKRLAADLSGDNVTLRTGVRLVTLAVEEGSWRGADDGGNEWRSWAVVLTPPVPQSLALLDASAVALKSEQRQALEQVRYAPCIAALLVIDGEARLPEPGAVQQPDAEIAWMADNRRKGISPGATVLTLHGSPTWSTAHYEDADEVMLPQFMAALHEQAGADFPVREAQIKRWRYALPLAVHPERYLHAAGLPPLYFGGDGFGSPRVEGAFLSGLEVGEALAAQLSGPPVGEEIYE